MKKVKPTTIIITLALLAIVIIVLKKMFFDNTSNTNAPNSSTGSIPNYTENSSSLSSVGANTLLKRGDKNLEVSQLQKYYNQKVKPYCSDCNSLSIDGVFGQKTENAVQFVTGAKTTTLNNFKSVVDMLPTSIFN